MKHKHHDMIVAKAENMDLVVFIKMLDNWEVFTKSATKLLSFSEDYDYFLCLPQHREVCLHWLNGGEVEARLQGAGRDFEHMTGNPSKEWSNKTVFISEECDIRIKPKKEKRWIATIDGLLSPSAVFDDKSKLESALKGMSYQIHEIHVEV